MIPDSVIDEIRGRVDCVALIGRHVELKRAGRTWKGCCPFHGERTPSFHVYPEDRHFKCYGCGEYGDVFKFLQKLQGKEFPEVVRALAEEVGVTIPERVDSAEMKRERQEKAEVHAACDAAARYFAARLQTRHGEPARRYLESRGVTAESVKQFRLGIAAPDWNDLPGRLVEKGIGEAALQKAGLRIPRPGGKPYDRFRGRLMFPIATADGQVIAFGGRAMGDEKGAKYINSPETLVYKKSKVLYGLDLAREHIRRARAAVLVEGYFDVIGLHQAGVRNAVAVCGTALTPEHIDLLKRSDCREVTLLFDGDVAGAAAPEKAAAALLPSGMAGKVALLPSEQGKVDPDEFARKEGKAAVERVLEGAVPLTEFLIDRAVEAVGRGEKGTPATVEAKLAAVQRLKPFVLMAPEGLPRSVFEERIAKRLDLDVSALRGELERPVADRPGRKAPPAREAPREGTRPARAAPARRATVAGSPAVDALAILAGHAEDAAVRAAAAEEDLPRLLPSGPLADLARALSESALPRPQIMARLEPACDAASLRRVKSLLGDGGPKPEAAERELRRAAVKSKIEGVKREHEAVLSRIAVAGSPAPEELTTEALKHKNRLRDLTRRLRDLDRG